MSNFVSKYSGHQIETIIDNVYNANISTIKSKTFNDIKERLEESENSLINLENKKIFNSFQKYGSNICVNTWIDNYADLARDIIAWKEMGVSIFRFPCIWGQVEINAGVYDFTYVLQMVELFNSNGIKSDIIINATNSLYGTEAGYPTNATQITAYVNYAKALINTMIQNGYSGQIYEIINEPNLKGSEAINYTNICKQVYPEIKSIDGSAKVYTHSTAYIPFSWIKTTFDEGILSYTDGISVHPYINDGPEVYNNSYISLHNLIKEYTMRYIPIIQGECGYSTVSNWNHAGINTIATDADRGIYLSRLLLNGLCFGFEVNNLHASYSNEISNANVEDWFGIIHQDGTLTLTYTALKNLYTILKDLVYVGIYIKGPTSTVLQFVNANGIMTYIGWTTKISGEKISINNKYINLSNNPNIVSINDNINQSKRSLFDINERNYVSYKLNDMITLRRYGKMVEMEVSSIGDHTVNGWEEVELTTIPYGYIPINTYFFSIKNQTIGNMDPLYLYVTNDGHIKLFNQGSEAKTIGATMQTVYHWMTSNVFPS